MTSRRSEETDTRMPPGDGASALVRPAALEARALADDVAREARLAARAAGDDALTAEFLLTSRALEWSSAWIEDGFESLSIAADQWRYFVEDGVDTAVALGGVGSVAELRGVGSEHLRRRVSHISEGAQRSLGLLRRGVARSLEPARSVWRPFFASMADRDR